MKGNLAAIIFFVLLLAVWQLAAALPDVQYYFADPAGICALLLNDTLNGILPSAAMVTAEEALAGFLCGIALGTPLGFLLWYSPFAAALSRPYLLALGALPVFSFAPLVIVWFGIGFSMKVAVAALGVGLLALTQAWEGANRFSVEQEQLFRLMGANRLQMLTKAVVPSSIDWVFNSLRLCVNTAILGAFIGEFISSSDGIGHYMNTRGALYDVPGVFAGGVYLILLAGAMQLAIGAVAGRKRAILRMIAVPRI